MFQLFADIFSWSVEFLYSIRNTHYSWISIYNSVHMIWWYLNSIKDIYKWIEDNLILPKQFWQKTGERRLSIVKYQLTFTCAHNTGEIIENKGVNSQWKLNFPIGLYVFPCAISNSHLEIWQFSMGHFKIQCDINIQIGKWRPNGNLKCPMGNCHIPMGFRNFPWENK